MVGVRKSAAVAAILAIQFALCTTASASTDCPTSGIQASEAQGLATVVGVVCEINIQRVEAGAQPVRWNWNLWWAAQKMAVDLRTRQYFAHVTPEGWTLEDRVDAAGYLKPEAQWSLGENLAWGVGPLSSPEKIVAGWLASPAHRDNVLDPDFEEIGIGIAQGSPVPGNPSGIFFVADFGRFVAAPPATTASEAHHKATEPRSKHRTAAGLMWRPKRAR